ncbi:hypothetical protein AB0B69_04525 [Micromonospora parva]|uniref:hypothetical protein n=1 Tax=Micromonospora parva TaxID=1464048 RepID=UPI0033F4C180
MVESDPPWELPSIQTNSGSGSIVNGHNFGRIETMDAKTKALLEKMSSDFPKLGALLRQALRAGAISPDMAASLSLAARNINEDVAEALWAASRNINYEVAELLMVSSQSINPQVASKISQAADDLDGIPRRLEQITAEMRAVARQVEELSSIVHAYGNFDSNISAILGASENLAMAANQVVPQPKPGRFLWGVLCGVLLVVAALALAAFGPKGT